MTYNIGRKVFVTADNYGSDAEIIDYREDTDPGMPSHYKVRTDRGDEFWAMDYEVDFQIGHDSRPDTQRHIVRVQDYIETMRNELAIRAARHDESKLQEPEKSGYDVLGQALHGAVYGTPEYYAVMNDPRIKGAIQHHVKHTIKRHHREANKRGIDGMTLIDILEMVCDWKAASERGGGKTFLEGLAINRERNGLSEQLYNIFVNTAEAFGWE